MPSLRTRWGFQIGTRMPGKEYEETLKTYRELAQKDPETYLPT